MDLFQAFPKVCQKAKSGMQLCQAVSAFIMERAGLESHYAQSLMKLAQSAKAEDWSEQLTECWATFQEATEHLAQERWAFAQTMQTAIAPGVKAFAAQQDTQVQRLIAEGTKMRWAQQQMISSMDKAREKYERKCQEAITAMRKNEAAEINSTSSDSSLDEVSASKELTDKLAAGAGQLLTKMWDTTSAFGRNPLERQRSKLSGCLGDVIAAEKHYIQTVEYTNAQRLIFEREIKENLHAFQLTEEQRLEYLRDVLMRMQKAFISMFSRSQQFVERMKASVTEVDELVDIEKGFQSLGSQEEVDVDRADLSINPFYLPKPVSPKPFEFRSLLAEPVSLSLATMKKKFKVASFSEIALMEKKNTALITSRSFTLLERQFTIKGEKVFFTSFVFRDECFQKKDALLGEYDLLLDEEVAFSVETAFSKLWIQSDAFAKSILDAAGATNISLPAWDAKPVSYTAVTKPCGASLAMVEKHVVEEAD
eukprot:jgi/Phyca11/17321/fgenesh1_pg.PHYCAscaffold_27_\